MDETSAAGQGQPKPSASPLRLTTFRQRFFPYALAGGGLLAGVLIGFSFTFRVPTSPSATSRPSPGPAGTMSLPSARQLQGVHFDQFWQVWDYVQGHYVREDVSDQTLFYGALEGMVSALDDPYSVFLEPTTSKQFQQDLSGRFEGIGAEIGIRNDRLTIIAPLPESPAQRAGLKAGDVVLAIDDQSALNLALDVAVSRIRGPKGEPVTLTVSRNGEKEPRKLTIVRDTIAIISVSWESLKDGNVHLNLKYFNEDTVRRFRRVAEQIVATRPKGIILDLRNNPGGFLEAAIEIASFWTGPDRPVVIEQQRHNQLTNHKPSNRETLFAGIPTVVLINRGSASGSEIVAGALQDYAVAQVVGETSFGKGSVQDFRELDDRSAVKLTIAKWLTPSGRVLEGKGVTPDFEVKPAENGSVGTADPQLEKAIELLRP